MILLILFVLCRLVFGPSLVLNREGSGKDYPQRNTRRLPREAGRALCFLCCPPLHVSNLVRHVHSSAVHLPCFLLYFDFSCHDFFSRSVILSHQGR